MNEAFLPGVTGLLLGLLLHWAGFARAEGLRHALGLRRSHALRSGLTALGFAAAFTALLMWLAVIDVDTVEVLPLSGGALIGGALLGVCAGLCGFTPVTAFAGLGAGNAAEALCVLAGGFLGTLLPLPEGWLAPLHTLPPYAPATLFRVTLDEPFLLGGGFLALGCLGLMLWAIAVCIPSPRPVILTEEEVQRRAAQADAQVQPAGEPAAPVAEESEHPEEVPSEDAAGETFVSLQEGEEPLVVDMDTQDAAPEDESADAP